MEPNAKRYRSESSWFGSSPRVLEQLGNNGGGSAGDQCSRFNTPEGCPYGSNCRFRHVPSVGQDIGSQGLSAGGRPKPCMKFFSLSGCQYGESCHFLHYVPGGLSSVDQASIASFLAAASTAHPRKTVASLTDPSAFVTGYKTKLCNRFNTAEGCRFGDKCHFAHGESDLRLPNNQAEVPGIGAPGLCNGGSDVSDLETFGSMSSLTSQVHGELNPPIAAVGDSSASYGAGSISENLQVY